MRWPSLLLLLLGAFLIVGCSEQPLIGGEKRTFEYVGVFSLSPSTTEVAGSLQLTHKFLGRTESCNYPSFLASKPVVTSGTKPDFETIMALKATTLAGFKKEEEAFRKQHPGAKVNVEPRFLAIYDAAVLSEADVAKFKELGIETMPAKVSTIEDLKAFIYDLMGKVGAETAGSQYVDSIESAREVALAAAPKEKHRTAVLMDFGGAEYMIAGLGTFQADEVRAAGGEPVGPSDPKFVQANIEELIKLNPQVIFTNGISARVLKDARLASLDAIKNKRVWDINPDALLRAGGRVPETIKAYSSLYQAMAKTGGAR